MSRLLFDEQEQQKLSLPNQPPNFGAALPRRTITPSLTSKTHWLKMWQKVSSYYIALRAIRADPFLFSNVEEQNEDYFF